MSSVSSVFRTFVLDRSQIALLGKVSRQNIERDVRHLSTAYPTRHTEGRFLRSAADWLAGRLRTVGQKRVSLHEYTHRDLRLQNVVGGKPGRGPKTILLCAHYDSRMQKEGDAVSPAPGANDNATGVAALLEVARLLNPVPLRDHLRFVFFSGEEQAYWGSRAYVREVRREKMDLRFVFNLDQIGYPPADRALFVDRDEGNRRRENDAASRALVARIQGLAKSVVRVPTRVDPAEGSDYIPFEAEGFVITGLYEAGKNYPAYHRSDDTAEKVDFPYVADMARLTLATILSEAGKG